MTDSFVLPLKAILMNALTVGAALAPLTLIYQHGRLTGLLGYTSNGGVEPSEFLVTATLVFALSTDYGVFLLGRIKEARDAGRRRARGGRGGPRRAPVAWSPRPRSCSRWRSERSATSSISFIQQIGVATATGVLVDAFVVRSLLVPSLMALLGRWNWWSPRATDAAPEDRAEPGPARGTGPVAARWPIVRLSPHPCRMICRAVAGAPARNAAVRDWLPVLRRAGRPARVDAAIASDGEPITALGVLAAFVGCLPLAAAAPASRSLI